MPMLQALQALQPAGKVGMDYFDVIMDGNSHQSHLLSLIMDTWDQSHVHYTLLTCLHTHALTLFKHFHSTRFVHIYRIEPLFTVHAVLALWF